MKKKVDQIFIENFRSWSGRHYFDLNEINFLFGSNSSGKSSIIHALSLLKQSVDNVSGMSRKIDFIKPNGYYTDLGSINKQAYTVIKNKNIKTSEFISFGYVIKGIDNLLNIGNKWNPLFLGRLNNFKKIELLKNLKEIKLTYRFSSSTGKLITIGLEIDELELIKIKDDDKEFKIYLPQNEDFWKKILNITSFSKNEKDEDVIFKGDINEDKKIKEYSDFIKQAQNSTVKLDLDNALLENKILQNSHHSNVLKEISYLQNIIIDKILIRYEKMRSTGFSDIELEDQFVDLTYKSSFENFKKSNKNVIYDLFAKLSDLNDFNTDKFEIISDLKIIKEHFNKLKDLFSKVSKENDLQEYVLDLNVANEMLNELKILDNVYMKNISLIDNWTEISKEEKRKKEIDKLISPFLEVFFFFKRFRKKTFNYRLLEVARNTRELELVNLKNSINQNLVQLKSDKNIIMEYSRLKEDVIKGKVGMPFKKFMDEIIKSPYISFNSKNGINSINDILNFPINRNFKESLLNVIERNIILRGTSPIDLLRLVQSLFLNNFHILNVIGPHRKRPGRIEILNPNDLGDNIGTQGENISNILSRASISQIKELNRRFKDLEIPYSVTIKKFKEDETISQTLVTDENGLSVSLTDVGYGVGQVLPIVIECIISKNKIITIEQPELHLHPKLQANLTDLIIWSSQKNDNKFILETHSEHLILRLQRRLRENFEIGEKSDPEITNLSNNVTINVVTMNKKERESQNKLLKITPSGNFNGKWPEGFFEERFVELGIE